MNIKPSLLILTLLPAMNLAQAAIGTCEASLPPVDPKRCNDPTYFAEYRAAADEAIRSTSDEKTNEIYQDNQANNETVVSSAKDNLSNFAQCQIDTCQTYVDTCTSADIDDVSARRFETEARGCVDQSENRFTTQKALVNSAVKLNVQTKAITTIEEKARAINARAKEILIPIMQNIAKLTNDWASNSSTLIKEPREATNVK